MDWDLAIERNRLPLLRIVAALCDLIGLGDMGAVERVSRPLHRAVLLVLRPAEAAVRRLIVVAARGLVVRPQQPRPAAAGLRIPRTGHGRIAFRICDPLRKVSEIAHCRSAAPMGQPRIRVVETLFDPRIPLYRPAPVVTPAAPAAPEDHTVDARPLCRRLAAIRSALEDLPRQARRYARWQARPRASRRPRRLASLRTGPPPGVRRRPAHEVEDILADCHWLARQAAPLDTS